METYFTVYNQNPFWRPFVQRLYQFLVTDTFVLPMIKLIDYTYIFVFNTIYVVRISVCCSLRCIWTKFYDTAAHTSISTTYMTKQKLTYPFSCAVSFFITFLNSLTISMHIKSHIRQKNMMYSIYHNFLTPTRIYLM